MTECNGVCGREFVSMKSGLEGRNNTMADNDEALEALVSMKSGLEGRNNGIRGGSMGFRGRSLNEVRPRRPEQSVRDSRTLLLLLLSQ